VFSNSEQKNPVNPKIRGSLKDTSAAGGRSVPVTI